MEREAVHVAAFRLQPPPGRNPIVTIDDGMDDPCSGTDLRIVHHDRSLDHRAARHPHAAPQDRAHHPRLLDERSLAQHAVLHVSRDDPHGRSIHRATEDRPAGIVEIELGPRTELVHLGVVVGADRAHVPPVGGFLVGPRARDAVVAEIVGEDAMSRNELGHDRPAEVVLGRPPRILAERVDQDLGREDVVPHRGERRAGIARHRLGGTWLLGEAHDATVRRARDDAEGGCGAERHRTCRHRHVAAAAHVVVDHLPEVHAVDVVSPEHHDQLGREIPDEVQVLEHGIGRTLVPGLARSHLWGHDRDEGLWQAPSEPPARTDVLDQRLRLVLDEEVNRIDTGIHEVAEHVVDDAMAAPERHCRLAARARERLQPIPTTPRHHDAEYTRHDHLI